MGKYDGYITADTQAAASKASDVDAGSFGSRVENPGTFRMKVVAKKFKTKDKKIIESPTIEPSTKTGTLMLKFSAEVVDGAANQYGEVKKGDYEYFQIPLIAAPGATEKKIENIAKLSKPRIKALVGAEAMESFELTEEWLDSHLTANFKKKGDKFEVTRDHKMTQEFMAEFEGDIYAGKPTLNLVSIKAAKDGDVSVITGPNIHSGAESFDDPSAQDEESIDALSDDTAEEAAPIVKQPTMF